MQKTNPQKLSWKVDGTAPELLSALRRLSTLVPDSLEESTGDPTVKFHQDPGLSGPVVEVLHGTARVRHATVAHALRGLGTVWAGLALPGQEVVESLPFDRLGVMIDCSRNAVMTPGHLKEWMMRLALLGFNQVLLYTEETYTVPGEPYFGYLRGRYTEDELREIDGCAVDLGIELTGCIQTLGHLEHLLKWSAYRDIKDTARVLMVDAPRTYELIDSMLAVFARNFRSKRIQIGMDETHDLGRGAFMDHHGYERGYDLFQRHLQRVAALCEKHGLRPMIWSDMYFRLGNAKLEYYDPSTCIPETVKQSIPAEVDLVYWDYYHEEQSFYEDWIRRHADLGHPAIMASGIWTWGGLFWYWHEKTLRTVAPCVEACRKQGVKELMFTLWGDDGAFCEYDSALAGLAYAAECSIYGRDKVDESRLAQRFGVVCGADYHAVCQAAEIQSAMLPAILFWDDPLLGIYWKNEELKTPGLWRREERRFGKLLRTLAAWKDVTEPLDFAHWHTVTRYLRKVMRLKLALDQAYGIRDWEALARLEKNVRRMPAELERCNQSFRRQWLRRNRPNGLETLQNRIGARKQRWNELAQRLQELRQGDIPNIPELEERAPVPVDVQGKWSAVAASGIV